MKAPKSKINTDNEGIALDGYDPVAYFTRGEPTKGSDDFTYEWEDASWHFSTSENQELFAADPAKYAPQFGGYCAVARVMGKTADGSPQRWKIDDDKLFLNKDIVAHTMSKMLAGRIRKLAA